MTTKKKKVLVALKMAGIAGQDKLAGVFRYLNERYGARSPWADCPHKGRTNG